MLSGMLQFVIFVASLPDGFIQPIKVYLFDSTVVTVTELIEEFSAEVRSQFWGGVRITGQHAESEKDQKQNCSPDKSVTFEGQP